MGYLFTFRSDFLPCHFSSRFLFCRVGVKTVGSLLLFFHLFILSIPLQLGILGRIGGGRGCHLGAHQLGSQL